MFLRSRQSQTAMRPSEPTSPPPNPPNALYSDPPRFEQHGDGDTTPGETTGDPHDLSLVLEGSRNSVVDHMLLSLDSLPGGGTSFPAPSANVYQPFGRKGPDGPPPEFVRRRSHTHSASMVSDYDLNVQDSFGSFAPSPPRRGPEDVKYLARQSQRDLSRQPTREYMSGGYGAPTYGRGNTSYSDERGDPRSRRHGRSGSNGSVGSGLDVGHNNGMPPVPTGLSEHQGFEYSQTSLAEQRMHADSMLSRGRPVPGGYWHTDAAPEPAVTSGPRRRTENGAGGSANTQMHPPLPGYDADSMPLRPKRRSSIRSATSRLSRRGRDGDTSSRANLSEVFNHPDQASSTDPLAAPSPSAGYRKDLIAQAAAQNTAKEKTGFFRRVFGSSKAAPVATPPEEPQGPPRPPTQQRQRSIPGHPSDPGLERERPRTQASLKSQSSSSHMASQMKGQPQPAPEVPPVPVEHQQTQTLNKKPSSFFRRRKKSVSESRPPVSIMKVMPTPTAALTAEARHAQQSPSISSLRKVMNPYLSDTQSPQQSPLRANFDGSDPVRSGSEVTTAGESLYGLAQHDERSSRTKSVFSGTHVPYDGPTIRPVTSGSPVNEDFPSSAWAGKVTEEQRPPQDNGRVRTKLRKSRPGTAKTEDEKYQTKDPGASEYAALRMISPTQPSFGPYHEPERPVTSPTRPIFPGPNDLNAPALPQQAGNLRKGQSGNVRELAMDHSKRQVPPTLTSPKLEQSFTAPPPLNDNLANKPRSPVNSSFNKQALPKSNRLWIDDDAEEPEPSPRIVSPLLTPADRIPGQDSGEPVSPMEDPSPVEGADVFHSATSLPIVQVEGDVLEDENDHNRNLSNDTTGSDLGVKITAAESVAIDTDAPQAEDQDRAAKIFAGDESVVSKAKAAAWLGETSFVAARTRKAYMDLFDWSGLSILNAFRELCLRLIVKAESQQLDRIIDAFSKRWCSCNQSNGFKAQDVVHTISYSILMLNTDLHIADMDSRMTRNEFVRNTLPTIRRIADLAAVDSADQVKGPQLSLNVPGDSPLSSPSLPPDQPGIVHAATDPAPRHSLETKRSKNRLSLLPPGLDLAISGYDAAVDNCTVLVNKPHDGSMKSWESQIEVVLREFYNSIKQTPLPLHGSGPQGKESHDGGQSSNNLTVSGASNLRRSPSVLSKAPSDTISYRGRSSELRGPTSRWPGGNKNRSRPRLYPPSTMASSRTSLDDTSVWSPAGSSTWSKYSLSKSQTQPSSWNTGAGSMSVESFGSGYAGEGYSQSIGFANALSQAIIREEHAAGLNIDDDDDDLEEFGRVRPLLEDESLELHGAPWAKEGMVKHRHHLEALDKKPKDRGWNECFAVVEKGYLRLFSFNQSSKSMKKKKKSTSRAGGAVGGGNWMDNAESIGCFLLRQTIASTLPAPGFSKQRPYVWALSLPNGAIHLFQVGTDDISLEFVKTANYWSARLSKEPLVGGVSNVEYGWSDHVINAALISRTGSATPSHASGSTSTAAHNRRPSIQSSIHGSLRGSSIDGGAGSVRARLPGDKATISQWSPPVQSMMASQLMEVDQLKALTAYVQAVEDDLDRHNALRQPMGFAFGPRHPNGQKALANWERKSAYLLREIVKFKTYVSSLTDAQVARERVERERAERKAVEAAGRPGDDGTSDHYGDDLAPETAEAVRRAENAEYLD